MILDIYKDSLEYSFKKGSTLLKLGLMAFFSFLIIPIFLIFGYNYRVIKIATNGMINGNEKLPEFNDLTSMFVDGVKYFIVRFVYLLIPLIVFFVFVIGSGYLHNGYLLYFGTIISLILALVCYLISLIAIPNMAENNDSLKAAFDFKGLFNIIQSIGTVRYIGFYLGLLIISVTISMVVGFILFIIFAIFGFVTSIMTPMGVSIIGGVIGVLAQLIFLFFIVPYLGIFENRAVGLIYNIRE